MIILTILAGLVIPQVEIEASLRAETDANENQFRSYMSTAAVLNESTMEDIGAYPYVSSGEQSSISDRIENRVENTLEPHTSTWSFQSSNSPQLEFSSDTSSGNGLKWYSSVKIASPSSDPVNVEVGVGDQDDGAVTNQMMGGVGP